MKYVECNMINYLHIAPIGQRRPVGHCPREELADPAKIAKFVVPAHIEWDVFQYAEEHPFFRAWAPWKNIWRMKDCDIRSVGVYVLTEHPGMFQSMHALVHRVPIQGEDIFEWLDGWWQTPFLITAPVLCQTYGGAVDAIPYFTNNRYHAQKLPIDPEIDVVQQLITGQGFTICNGLIMFLAMIRQKLLPVRVSEQGLQRFLQTNPNGPQFLMDMGITWGQIYLLHTTPHIADFPWMYARMGRNPAPASISNILRLSEDVFIPQFGAGNEGSITSLVSSILPYAPMEMLWPTPPTTLEDTDEFVPDIAGFVLGVVRTRSSFQWWCEYGYKHVIRRTLQFWENSEVAMEAWLSPIMHFYVHAKEHTPRLKYSRLRRMWFDVMEQLDPVGVCTFHRLRNWIIKDTVLHEFERQGYMILSAHMDMPFMFLHDAFEKYKNEIRLWKTTTAIIYASPPMVLLQSFPEGSLRNDGGVRVVHNMFHYFQSAPLDSSYRCFFQAYIQKRIVSRLLGIQKGFGVLPDEDPLLDRYDGRLPLVGFLLLEHLRDHKECLVF